MNRPLIAATRKETQYQLNVIAGEIPGDWYGEVFVASPAGTVNSGGLPYKETDQEYGSPIMNGDGYTYRFSLSPLGVAVQTRLMKPPCYYADLATNTNDGPEKGELFSFRSMGLTRMSLDLGARNELNTAITPFRFKQDLHARMLACYDAGRPWEIDIENLNLISAIGYNSEYIATTPDYLFPFPVIQCTAHPSFDPYTQELFIVNFTKSMGTMSEHEAIVELLRYDTEKVEGFLKKLISGFDPVQKVEDIIKSLENLAIHEFDTIEQKVVSWVKGLFHSHQTVTLQRQNNNPKSKEENVNTEDNVYLMRWDGSAGPLDRWKVVDQNGDSLHIKMCMHQTTITEDYLILADASFKFAFDLLFNSPFKNDEINAFLRKYLTMTQEPYLDIYIVKRSDLQSGQDTVSCKKLNPSIPLEAIHFTADYRNPNGQITLHCAHNSAACLAEWVRTFDYLAPHGIKAVDPEVIGLMSVGCMDIGRIGKFVLDAESAEILHQEYIVIQGNLKDPAHVGAHTWGVGLYTFRDLLSPYSQPDRIDHIYWSCYGLDPRLLTKFIYDLYGDYPNRMFMPDQISKITESGIPFVLSRQNTSTMEIEDYYQFDFSVILKSIQFVPRKEGAVKVTDDPQMDGYIFSTELVNYPNDQGDNYQCEIWIFKAWDLAAGPICRMSHPDLDFAFTLHSAFTNDAISQEKISYKVDVKEDYDQVIAKLKPDIRKQQIDQFFNKYIYPNF